MEIRIQDCARCNQPPVVTCDAKGSRHEYNLAHRCPDGTVARGARYWDRNEVIKQWNGDQIQIALRIEAAANKEGAGNG